MLLVNGGELRLEEMPATIARTRVLRTGGMDESSTNQGAVGRVLQRPGRGPALSDLNPPCTSHTPGAVKQSCV